MGEAADSVLLGTLDLGKNAINGTIPPELFGIESLRTIKLRRSRLTGTIPAAIGNLKILGRL